VAATLRMSKIAYAAVFNFLAGTGPEHRGLSLRDVLSRPDEELEDDHAYIQWLFPLDTPSEVNEHAPVLTRAELRALGENVAAAAGTAQAFDRMMAFLGLEARVTRTAVTVAPGPAFSQRAEDWLLVPTHNDLRISRMLRSLALQAQHSRAQAFLEALTCLIGPGLYGQRALTRWRAAAQNG